MITCSWIKPRNGWVLKHEDYFDSDNLRTDWWEAHHPDKGHRILAVSPYRFHMTQDRFNWLVDNNFPRRPGGNNWSSSEIDQEIANASAS